MTTIPVLTKKTRRETIIKVLREILKEVKAEKRPSQTFQYLIDTVKQFEKYKNDKELLALIKDFNVWFENHKRENHV